MLLSFRDLSITLLVPICFPKYLLVLTCGTCFDTNIVVCHSVSGQGMKSPSPCQAHIVTLDAVTFLCISAHCQLLTFRACWFHTHMDVNGCAHHVCDIPHRNIFHIQNLGQILVITQNCCPILLPNKGGLFHFKQLQSIHMLQPTVLQSQNTSPGKHRNSVYFLMGLHKWWY